MHDKPLKMESASMLVFNLSFQVLLKIPNNKHFYAKLAFEANSEFSPALVKLTDVLKVDSWIKNEKHMTF